MLMAKGRHALEQASQAPRQVILQVLDITSTSVQSVDTYTLPGV